MECVLNILADLPGTNHAGYAAARQRMVDEILDDVTLATYLVMSNTPLGAPRVTVIHSLARSPTGRNSRRPATAIIAFYRQR